LRPRRLSVSDIARLMANPYAVYARHILALHALDPLAAEPGRADEGRILHRVLHSFARRHPAALPADAAAELLAIFDERVAEYGENARIAAFWRPRLERFARWFEATEPQRRGEAQTHAEAAGELTVAAPAGPFTLRCTADRIDVMPDGSVAIYDYRTGSGQEKDVTDFTAPQLGLQALIAQEGGFRAVRGERRVAKLAWLLAKGEEGGEEKLYGRQDLDTLAEDARNRLTALLTHFDDETTPYTAMRRGGFKTAYRFDDYAHLARVEEWSGVSEEG
jgi:ATP-dependent helicase/nuclease subunit B